MPVAETKMQANSFRVISSVNLKASAKGARYILVVSSEKGRVPLTEPDLKELARLLGWPFGEAKGRFLYYELTKESVGHLYLRLRRMDGRWVILALDSKASNRLWGSGRNFVPVFLRGVSKGTFGVFAVTIPAFSQTYWSSVTNREKAEKFMYHMLGEPILGESIDEGVKEVVREATGESVAPVTVKTRGRKQSEGRHREYEVPA
jgi:hypothetical protein